MARTTGELWRSFTAFLVVLVVAEDAAVVLVAGEDAVDVLVVLVVAGEDAVDVLVDVERGLVSVRRNHPRPDHLTDRLPKDLPKPNPNNQHSPARVIFYPRIYPRFT